MENRSNKILNKIKIVIVTPDDFSAPRGTPIRIRKIVENIVENDDFDVSIFTKTDIEYLNVLKLEPESSYIKNVIILLRHYRKNRNDIFLCHTLITTKYILVLKLLTRAKVVLEMHGFNAEEAYENHSIGFFKYVINKNIHKIVFACADMITTCSPTATETIKKYNKNTSTVYSGVDTEVFNSDVVPTHNFKKFESDIIVGYAGNARHWQGLDFLLEAFSALPEKLSSLKLVVLSSEEHDFKSFSSDRIQFTEKVPHEEMPGFLVSCDVLVIPRRHSIVNKLSIPSKVFEYMAVGKPVIASSTSDVFHVIVDRQSGLLFKPGDQEEFYQRLETLLNVETRRKMGEEACKRIQSNFTWEMQLLPLETKLKALKN